MKLVGEDAARLLAWVQELADQSPGQGEQVKLLQRLWNEHFELDPPGLMQQREAQPPYESSPVLRARSKLGARGPRTWQPATTWIPGDTRNQALGVAWVGGAG